MTGSNDAARLVLWYKDSDPQPVYSFDNRYTKPKHWSQDPNFGSKAFFRHSVEPAQMIISSVTLKDAGIYKCRIDFKQSPTVTNEVELKIIQESKKPVIIGKALSFIKMFHNFPPGGAADISVHFSHTNFTLLLQTRMEVQLWALWDDLD